MKPYILRTSGSPIASGWGLWRQRTSALVLVAMATQGLAAATLKVEVEGTGDFGRAVGNVTQTIVNQMVTIQFTVTNGKVSQRVKLPPVDGLTVNGTGTQPQSHGETYNFFLTPSRTGDITIPTFDIRTDDGEMLHIDAIKLRVVRQ